MAADPGSRPDRDRALFDAIAPAYCRKDLLPDSRRARRQRLERTVRWIPLSAQSRILEVGCGAGFAASYLRGRYRDYVGIDASSELIALAREYNGGPGVSFACTDVESFEPGARFDAILLVGVLHHMERRPAVLRRLVSWLEPGGWLAANEPQPANPLFHLARRVRKRLEAGYADEQDEISGRELRTELAAAGLADVRLVPQGLFSTPFAEVILRPRRLARLLAPPACALDAALETGLGPLLRPASWNLIAVGRRPAPAEGSRRG